MTDEVELTSPEETVSKGPGSMLILAREKAGLSQQDIADKLFLKRVIIEDIENDHTDASKSLTFTKGYVRSYARLVGLNVEEVLALFDGLHQKKPQDDAKLQSFSRRVAKQAHDDRWMMVTYGILFLLIAAVVMWWFQQPKNNVGQPATEPSLQSATNMNEESSNISTTSLQSAEVENAVETPAITEQNINETVDNAYEVTEDVADTGTETPNIADDVVQEMENPNTPDSAKPPAEESSVMDEDLATLVFIFEQDCWVNIKDASGEAKAYGVKAAGRIMEVSGIPPFDITLGAPHVVQISYNGEDVDMSSFTGREIGRLTLPIQE